MAILEGLPLLQELPRGDFLCDALEWLDETDPERCSRFFFTFTNSLLTEAETNLKCVEIEIPISGHF